MYQLPPARKSGGYTSRQTLACVQTERDTDTELAVTFAMSLESGYPPNNVLTANVFVTLVNLPAVSKCRYLNSGQKKAAVKQNFICFLGGGKT